MECYEALFSAVFNILSLYVNIRVIKLFLHPRHMNAAIKCFIYALVWFINWYVYYMFHILDLTTTSLFFGLLFIAYFLFEGGRIKKIMAAVASIVLVIGAENVVWLVFGRGKASVENEAVQGICAALLALIIILLIERFFTIDKSVCLPGSSYLNMIFISVGSGIVAEIIVISDSIDRARAMIGLTIICLMNVGVYYLFEKTIEAYGEKIQKSIMEQQVKMYINQFDIISQSQQRIRSIRHDLKNHMLLLKAYLMEEKCNEALSYIDRLESGLDVSNEYAKSGNMAIDSIINYMLERTGDFCCPNVEIEVPDHVFISDFDLNIVLGNLLDNAIEAVQGAKNKQISIKLKYNKGVFYIGVHNSYDGILKRGRGKFPGTKKNKGYHGIGLVNVQAVVDKYKGIMEISNTGDFFKIDIVLYVEVT